MAEPRADQDGASASGSRATRGRRPRVALVTNMPTYHQIDLFNAIEALDRFDFRVFYLREITPGRQWTRFGREIEHDHVFVEEVKVHPYFYLNRGFVPALRAFDADLHIVGQYASIAMQGLMYASIALRRPWVFWSEKAGVEFTENPIVSREWLRQALRQVATLPLRLGPAEIWGIGQTGREYYAQRYNRPVYNIPYYASLDRFWAIERQAPEPGREQVTRLLYMGKFNERKGFDLLMTALSNLLDDEAVAERFTIDFIGDGPMRDQLERLVERAPERVRYHGFVEVDEVPDYMGPADVLVAPSRFDGWGMVVTEGMAAGLPVVSTPRTIAARDMVTEGVDGWLAETGSAADLERALRLAIETSRQRLGEMSDAAREASQALDARVGARRMATRIEAILGR